METLTTVAQLQERLDARHRAGHQIGFVPTMGCLHAGHLSLISASVADNPLTIVSIFVNPLQFGEGEDFDCYPRDRSTDSAHCEALGVDYLFVPTNGEMYPDCLETNIALPPVAYPLEGVARPHHFAGVARAVVRLFSIIGPCRAYFGAKDWQQVCVVQGIVNNLNMPVEVVVCPTVRESDGLAMSSRNVYLSDNERTQAPLLRAALDAGLAEIANGQTDPTVVEATMAAVVGSASLATLDYAAAVQAETLVNDGPLHGEVRLLLAVRFSKARLIDNDGAVSPVTQSLVAQAPVA